MTIGRLQVGPQKRGYLQTTDATADQELLVVPIPFKHSAQVRVVLSGVAGADSLNMDVLHAISRDGATATYVGEIENDTVSVGAGAWVVTVDANGVNLRVRVTGEAAHTIEWTATAYFENSAVNVPIIAEWSTTKQAQSHTIWATSLAPYWIDWGDGSFTAGTGSGANQVVAHNYASAGSYHQRWMIADPADLINIISHENGLRGQLPAASALTNLQLYSFRTNPSIYGSVPSMLANSALKYLIIKDTALSGTIPTLTGNPALIQMIASGCSFTAYTASTIAATCVEFHVNDNLLPESAVDQILADFATGVAGRPAVFTVSLGGTGNAAPSAAGLASKAAILAAKPGAIITHN